MTGEKRGVTVIAARGRHRWAAVVCAAVAAAGVLAATASASWNQYRGNAARTGGVLWNGTSAPVGVVDWRKELGPDTMIDASPIVNPNTGAIYLGATGESPVKPGARLFAFYPNGNLQWAVSLNGYDVRAAPAVRRDGFPVVVGERAVPLVDHRKGRHDASWKLSERAFLIDPFTGAARAIRSVPEGWYGMSPAIDESRGETYVRTSHGLWRLDSAFALRDSLKAAVGATSDFSWSDLLTHLPVPFGCQPFCIDFDPSAPAGPRRPGSEPPQPPRLPSPAFSATCDDVVWGIPQSARARAVARGARAFGYLEPPTPLATPALGKAGRMYAPVLDERGRVYMEAYDQFSTTPAWRTGPLGHGPVSPPALGRSPRGRASTTASCTRVRNGKRTIVRDHRPESAYVVAGHTLYAFDDRGHVRWKHSPSGGQPGEPVVARLKSRDELVLVAATARSGNGAYLVAYRSNGRVAWRVALDAPALGSPAIAHGRVYVATTRSLYAIR